MIKICDLLYPSIFPELQKDELKKLTPNQYVKVSLYLKEAEKLTGIYKMYIMEKISRLVKKYLKERKINERASNKI